MAKISSVSFDLERTTRAANPLVYAWIFFISMLLLFLPIVLIILITDILGYMHIYLQVPLVLMVLVAVFMVISPILMVTILPSLMSAYEINENTITRGFLRKVPTHVKKGNYKAKTAATVASATMLKTTSDFATSLRTDRAIEGSFNLSEVIRKNADSNFVEEFFHTECFNKKTYYNPVLVKTTKHAYIYKCDNKKRLVIRKLYSNMDTIGTYKPRSLKQRIMTAVLLVILSASILTVGTVYANMEGTNHYNNVVIPAVASNIETYVHQFEAIEYEFDNFEKKSSTGFYTITFRYCGNEDTDDSVITYRFDYDGKIKLNNIFLYIAGDERDGDRDLNNELNLLLSFPSEQFSENTIDEISVAIQDAIDHEITIKSVTSDDGDFKMTIKRFDSCVCVY